MISFDPVKHKYTNTDTGENYISVTSMIGLYKQPFDINFHSKRIAEREGVQQDTIKKRWRKIKNDACDYGTNVHEIIEEHFVSDFTKNIDHPAVTSFMQIFPYKGKKALTFKNEQLLFNHDFKLAGTADLIIDKANNTFDILDIKTNKEIRFQSPFGKFLLNPLGHLSDCEYSVYSMQVSVYAYMYHKLTGRNIDKLCIFWFNKKTQTFESIPIMYMEQETSDLLNHYIKTI